MTTGSLIRELGLTPCHGITPSGHYCHTSNHHIGDATPGVVHIVDRPLKGWPDKKRFLLLCAQAFDPTLGSSDEPVWHRVYRANMAARETGARLHIRVPAPYLRFDRRVVRDGVDGISNDVPLRQAAFDWARR